MARRSPVVNDWTVSKAYASVKTAVITRKTLNRRLSHKKFVKPPRGMNNLSVAGHSTLEVRKRRVVLGSIVRRVGTVWIWDAWKDELVDSPFYRFSDQGGQE